MEVYDSTAKQGLCLVFYHQKYNEPVTKDFADAGENAVRQAAEFGVEAIRSVFQCEDFEYRKYSDATRSTIFEEVVNAFKSTKAVSSIFVFILTHGGSENTLYAVDGHYDLKDLITEATNKSSQNISGIPKVFIIDACSGNQLDCGTSNSPSVATGQEEHYLALPHIPHLLMAFSSAPGYMSVRNWFIISLCNAIKQYSNKYDLKVLLTLARRVVAGITVAEDGNIYKQTPISISTLTKKLKLKLKKYSKSDSESTK